MANLADQRLVKFLEKWLSHQALPWQWFHSKAKSQLQSMQLRIAEQTDGVWLALIDTDPDGFSALKPGKPDL